MMNARFISNLYGSARVLLALFSVALATVHAVAVPADPRPKRVQMADGTWVTVRQVGDENASAVVAADGRLLSLNAATGRFDVSRVQSLAEALHTDKPRRAIRRSQGPQRIRVNDYPTTGSPRSLVLLVEFSDVKFSAVDNPTDFYRRMLNEQGFTWSNGADGSARDFYVASSSGRFTPDFVVAGPVTLPNTAAYYGADYPSQDANAVEALRDACLAADAEVDFSQFDTNGDGTVDNIYYFYAGYGQADNPSATNAIWPHSASLKAYGIDLKCDGVTIDGYACSNELAFDGSDTPKPTGIGTFVHEFGHVLGLADHYDVFSSSTYTVGPWDTMSTGSYNNNCHTPALFSAFERAELGWLGYTDITAATDSVCLIGGLDATNSALRVVVPGNDNEYYILENRQQEGWDRYLPGHGMVVWHIDMDDEAWLTNTVNVSASHQRVDIIAADNKRTDNSRDADPFPGVGGVTSVTLTSWAGNDIISFDAIAEQRGMVKIAPATDALVMPAPAELRIGEPEDSCFTLTWAEVPQAERYELTISCTDGPIEGYDGAVFTDVPSLTVGGLSPETTYEVSVTAAIGGHRSAPLTRRVTTTAVPFAKLQPAGVQVTALTGNAFGASWQAVRDADSYVVTLAEVADAAPEGRGYGFDNKADGMPAEWSTSSTTYYSVGGYYGAAAPSLRMSADGDYLEMDYGRTAVTALSFWCRSRNGDGQLFVERWSDAEGWTVAATLTPTAEGSVLSASFGGAPRVRLRYSRATGFVVIDDVVATCVASSRTPLAAYDRLNVGNVLSYSFGGLVPERTYSLTVTAQSAGNSSLPSDECVVTTLSADGIGRVTATPPAGIDGRMYDLSGRPVPSVIRHRGIVIMPDGSKRVVK